MKCFRGNVIYETKNHILCTDVWWMSAKMKKVSTQSICNKQVKKFIKL